MRLLLLLDEPSANDACSDFFETKGCSVDTAESVAEAEALLRFRPYDLVVADVPWAAPLLEKARHNVGTRVLLTTRDVEVLGADDALFVLTKPQPLETLLGLAAPARATTSRTSRSSRS